ncbi:MAG: hypothetical protein NC548_26985 [Lachnospiraceae bacterium]|nr:hypothetical protein [Lachnospiraceae bacterium]
MKCFKCGQGELQPITKDGKAYAQCSSCGVKFTADDLRNLATQKAAKVPPQTSKKQNSSVGFKVVLISGILLLVLIIVGVAFALITGLIGSEKITDFTGTWKSEETNGSYQEAIITGDSIEINWVSDNGKTKSLYWLGSFSAPSKPVSEYSWTSNIDKDETDMALFASMSDTKNFTYKNGTISYEVSALGSTTIVELKKQ